MSKKETSILIGVFIAIVLLTNLPFLPGPKFLNTPSHFFYFAGQLLGLSGLILVPLGLFLAAWRILKSKFKYQILIVFLSTIPLVSFISTMFISKITRNFSRNYAIEQADYVIKNIEIFKQEKGFYPANINDLELKSHSSGIIGIGAFQYKIQEDNYELTFYQDVTMGFNYEIVSYNKADNHTLKGEMKNLIETGYKHWKYEIYD